VALAGYYGFKFGNKWDLVPSNTVEAVIDSIYREKKMVVATMVFTPKNVRYTEHLKYDKWQIPWVGTRGFQLDPDGKILVGLGYDLKQGHKVATVVKAQRKGDQIKVVLEVEKPLAITMDCRADIRWSWSFWTGQPTQAFAYSLIESELFGKANQNAGQNEELTAFAQTMCTEWYTMALKGAGFANVQIDFRQKSTAMVNKELFNEAFVFEWQRDSSVLISDNEAKKILAATPGKVTKKIWELFE
jgi:hypothetical protein